jgi:hypothetical protein
VLATSAVLDSEPLGPDRMTDGGAADVVGAVGCGALALVGLGVLGTWLARRR